MTGATGLVGSHTAEILSRRGVRLRALVRRTSQTGNLEALGAELVYGSLTEPETLRRATEGVDVILHLAAATRARRLADYDRTNDEGTRALVEAALAAARPPRRFIYLSSMAAVGPSRNGRPVEPGDTPRPLTAYGRSKLAGEQHCHSVSGGMQVIVLRAPAVYGPRDRDLYHFFRIAEWGILPVPTGPPRPVQLIHVRDLAHALEAAIDAPDARGIIQVAAPEAFAWERVSRMIADALGQRARVVRVPAGLVSAAGALTETLGKITGRAVIFNRDKARELLAPGWLCDTRAMTDELGFAPRVALADGLRETVRWYRDEGWL